ncbi:unnamed protein product [Trichobilharzia szidati]|nr:unnamed protein product [Trichobilharzia szidati]
MESHVIKLSMRSYRWDPGSISDWDDQYYKYFRRIHQTTYSKQNLKIGRFDTKSLSLDTTLMNIKSCTHKLMMMMIGTGIWDAHFDMSKTRRLGVLHSQWLIVSIGIPKCYPTDEF